MRKTLIAILIALALAVVPAAGVFAASSQDVTVSATPAYISITNSPSTWTLNGITGDGMIRPDTTYYANPLGDESAPSATVASGECRFSVTNEAGSNVSVDFTVTCSDFSGGDADMLNVNQTSGDNNTTNGATDYLAYCWYDGMTYANKVLVKVAGSSAMYSVGLAPNNSLGWGAEILTQTNEFGGASLSQATMTITATEH